MTKARDLAGFSTGSITNTTADGLILKGDGSSTDVVIKNGADATVATVSDGSTNLSVAGSVTGALARGAIQVGNSSGVAAALAKGTSGYVLTAGANDLSWAEGGSGGLAFIASTDISNAATVNFTGFDSSKYDAYRFVFSNIVSATDNVSLDVRTSSDGGSSYDSGSNDYRMNLLQNGTNSAYSANNFGVGAYIGSETNENGTSGELIVFGAHLVQNTYLIVQSLTDSNTGALITLYNTGFRTSVADVDALQFLAGSGNLESGTITMYGMVNS